MPAVPIHDATTATGRAALFGFVGVPAQQRKQAGQETIIAASTVQLTRLFGAKAASPVATLFKDWAADPLTATAGDQAGGEHLIPGLGHGRAEFGKGGSSWPEAKPA